jgi:hypothetical protein
MTLRMADGPVANLPPGMDAYAGYTDMGGIGITWPQIQQLKAAYHLSISIHGAPAMCGDVEKGALASWAGYDVGYAAASNVGPLILRYGRPRKLWVAHYTNGPHICSSAACWPSSPVAWEADGTQWTDHGGVWDESLLGDHFFDPPGGTMTLSTEDMQAITSIVNANVTHALSLILYGDSQAAAGGKGIQGHPFNLYQIKVELDQIKAMLAKPPA